MTLVHIDLVFLHQKLDAVHVLLDDVVLSGDHLRQVHFQVVQQNPMGLESMGRIVKMLRGIQ
jgi:hypothetical protein